MEKAQTGDNLENLSLTYKRSNGAIKLRIIHNILKYVVNDDDIIEYCKSFSQIKDTDVIEYKNKREAENIIRKDKKKIESLDKLKYKTQPSIQLKKKGVVGLSEKQQQAYNLIMKGKNVFITSPGGYEKVF